MAHRCTCAAVGQEAHRLLVLSATEGLVLSVAEGLVQLL
jgi:hypothetical protein